MYYVQFYQASAINPSQLIEASGDRSVVILDGRMARASMGSFAEGECLRRKYRGWRLFKGENFTRSQPVSQLWYFAASKVDKTAAAATHGA